MVVVPTSHHVSLSYGTTPVDYAGWAFSILGLIGLAVLVRRPVAPVRSVRRTGMVRMPDWAVDMSYLGDALKGAWGREASPTVDGPGAPIGNGDVHNGAGATHDEDGEAHNGAESSHGAEGADRAGAVGGGPAETGEAASATREA